MVLRGGQLEEHGSYQDLDTPGTVMPELLAAE